MYTAKNVSLIDRSKEVRTAILDMFALIILIFIYILNILVSKATFRIITISKSKIYQFIVNLFDRQRKGSISKIDLVEISVRNMNQKKARAMVTIGGMAIGIAVIVFLVSIGYGLQELVVSRVARLEEMRQTDVIPQVRGKVSLNDKTLAALKASIGVEDVQPLIAVVGHVTYNSSVTDVVAYGVTTKYLETSAIQPIAGKLYSNNDIAVADKPILTITPSVIPVTTITPTIDPNSEWVTLEQDDTQNQNTTMVAIPEQSTKEVVVNKAFLKVLGLEEQDAVGKKFTVSYVIVGDLLPQDIEKLQSVPTEFSITGVTPDAKTPIIYLPFADLRGLGITQFSQAKVIVKDEKQLATVRSQAEAMGFVTQSVVDTVVQINSLFATARIFLLLLGMVALSVATLGMFNTLTVSLLERTREVGLMKAMGMRSSEIQELFFTESIIMGLVGGILGLLGGFIAGKLLGLLLALLTITNGAGFIDISYIPPTFVVVILALSLIVGILTGMYPARRATKISALNALRYE